MYISYNWLKDFLKIPSRIKPGEIASELTNHTVEVEGFKTQADEFANIVVGKVLAVDPHPNANRLHITKVDIKSEELTIVCGAPNVAVGQLVPVALPGASLPNGLDIKAAEIRGIMSAGMICAEDEIGLGSNHEGIMVLKDNAKVGEKFSKYLGIDDIIFEVDNKSLSNRPDLLSHYGLARELSAIFDWPLKPYEKLVGKFDASSSSERRLDVKVEDSVLCPRYQAVAIEGIKISESPAWLKGRLIAVQQRPINNIVDLTNYIMLECGQPLHAFDGNKVQKITVRRANKKEEICTLDDKERLLDNNDLVISDGRRAIAIAGVMGGRDSEIDESTTKIILEAANFEATSIRRTAQKIGLRTEASLRFEKSLDPNLTQQAIGRFLTLLKDICPSMSIASPILDINHASKEPVIAELDLDWLEKKIGQRIPDEKVRQILERLGFSLTAKDNVWEVTVPSWRATRDVSTREDLAEEILRLYGYDLINSSLPKQILNLPYINQDRQQERRIKRLLADKYCLTEVYNYAFVSEDQLTKTNIDFSNHLRLANPLSDMYSLLRQSLVPGLLANIKNNQAKADKLGLFEVGSTFFNSPGNIQKENNASDVLPYQEKRLGIALADNDDDLFLRAKGLISSWWKDLSSTGGEMEFSADSVLPGWADRKIGAKIIVNDQELGYIAVVSQATTNNLNLKKQVVVIELNLDKAFTLSLSAPLVQFQEIPKYPPVTRDLAFVVDEKISYNDFRHAILDFDLLIINVDLFDVYSGNKLEAGEKSLAFHVIFQSAERTLTMNEIDAVQSRLVAELTSRFEARLRSF